MDFKRTGFWILAIAVTSILFVGRLTDFTYKNLEVQLHDTYYVFDPFTIALIMVITLGMVSMGVAASKVLSDHHLFLRIVLILIISALLFIPMLMLYMHLMAFFAR